MWHKCYIIDYAVRIYEKRPSGIVSSVALVIIVQRKENIQARWRSVQWLSALFRAIVGRHYDRILPF
jgi:hypothetical protein